MTIFFYYFLCSVAMVDKVIWFCCSVSGSWIEIRFGFDAFFSIDWAVEAEVGKYVPTVDSNENRSAHFCGSNFGEIQTACGIIVMFHIKYQASFTIQLSLSQFNLIEFIFPFLRVKWSTKLNKNEKQRKFTNLHARISLFYWTGTKSFHFMSCCYVNGNRRTPFALIFQSLQHFPQSPQRSLIFKERGKKNCCLERMKIFQI